MLKFLIDGFKELQGTVNFTKRSLSSHYQEHFPYSKPDKQLFLFLMLCYASLILILPRILSLVLSAFVVILAPLALSTVVFAQSLLKSALFWGRSIKRLKNQIPNAFAPLQENILLVFALSILSWLPILGLQLRAFLLLPLLTTEIFMVKQTIQQYFSASPQEIKEQPITASIQFIKPVAEFSGLNSTLTFFGLPTLFPNNGR